MPRRPRDRKNAIVAAAAELFADRGFAAVGVDDIGAAVGITGPAVYRHFAGKDAVLAAVVDRAVAALTEAMDRAAPGGIAAVAEAAVTFTLDHRAPVATVLREQARGRPLVDPDAERHIGRTWRDAILEVRPDVDRARLTMRRMGIFGALSAAATTPHRVERPRLDGLLTAAALAVAVAPPRPATAPARRAPIGGGDRRWRPVPSRRDALLAAALRLFRQRGYHGVGIDEIGAATGMSGPTVYHYVDAKSDLLVDAFDRATERVAAATDDALRGAASARDALERLARAYARVATDDADLMVVTGREADALPDDQRRRIGRRARAVLETWVAVVDEVRPDLTATEARLLVQTVFPLVNAAVATPDLTDELAGLVVAYLTAAETP